MRKYSMPAGPRGRSGRRFWTADEFAILLAMYAMHPARKIAELLGRPLPSVYVTARKLGLSKSPDFEGGKIGAGNPLGIGTATRFKPGQTSWNKGLHYVAGGRSQETRFRRGHKPANGQDVGALRINGDGYLDIKVAPGVRQWVALHRFNWFLRHGEYPPAGMSLVFRDGDCMNCEVENLELVDRAGLMRRNSYHNYGPEIARAIQLRGALQRQINRRLGA